MVESTDEYTLVRLDSESATRRDRSSFHVFSEPHIRGEVFNFSDGDRLNPMQYKGALLILGITGNVDVTLAGITRSIGPLSQILINQDVAFSLVATEQASVQLVWAPPFGKTKPDGHSTG
jgi:hypothetical protein